VLVIPIDDCGESFGLLKLEKEAKEDDDEEVEEVTEEDWNEGEIVEEAFGESKDRLLTSLSTSQCVPSRIELILPKALLFIQLSIVCKGLLR